MDIAVRLAAVAVRPLAAGAADAAGLPGGSAVVDFLAQRFTDHSQRLNRALGQAHDRAWTAIELSLAGTSWWERCRARLAAAEDRAFREQVQAFLTQVAAGREELREQGLD